jgi:Fe-S-cluster containining protein
MEDLEELDPATFWGDFRRLAEAYLGHGPGRTQAWHERIDRLLEQLIERDQRYGYPPPFCSKGCCNCCHEPVYCTGEEAGEILEHCRREGIAIDAAKLERQLAWLEVDGARDHTGTTRWNDQPEADQSCVFLDPAEGACRIWQVRPFVCRVHLAEGTGDYCRPRNGVPDPRARGISYPEWSYVLSVIFTIHQDSIRKSLGRLLLGT